MRLLHSSLCDGSGLSSQGTTHQASASREWIWRFYLGSGVDAHLITHSQRHRSRGPGLKWGIVLGEVGAPKVYILDSETCALSTKMWCLLYLLREMIYVYCISRRWGNGEPLTIGKRSLSFLSPWRTEMEGPRITSLCRCPCQCHEGGSHSS